MSRAFGSAFTIAGILLVSSIPLVAQEPTTVHRAGGFGISVVGDLKGFALGFDVWPLEEGGRVPREGKMIVLRLSTLVVLIRTSLWEPRAAAAIARGGLHKTLLMVRRVSLVPRLFARQTIVRKLSTVNLRETTDDPMR